MSRTASKLTDRLIEEVEAAVAMGNFRDAAFKRVMIPTRTWGQWVSIGKAIAEGDTPPRKVSDSHAERCHRLYLAVRAAEGNHLIRFNGDTRRIVSTILNDDEADYRIKLDALRFEFELIRRRHSKIWNPSPKSLDDETGTTHNADPVEILRERLIAMLPQDGES